MEYVRGRRRALYTEVTAMATGTLDLKSTETALVILAEDEPASYSEAMKSTDKDKWRKACEQEINLLDGYKTWTLVEQPKGKNIVGSRWTFQVKRDNIGQINRHKAQLVARVGELIKKVRRPVIFQISITEKNY